MPENMLHTRRYIIRQRRLIERRQIRTQMLGIPRPRQNHMGARFIAAKAIGGLRNTPSVLQKEVEWMIGIIQIPRINLTLLN